MDGELDAWVTRRRLAAAGLAAAGLAFLVMALPTLTQSPGWGYDFEAYFWAAQRVARGEPAYWRYTLDGPFNPGPWGIYLYAPPLAVSLLPFTMLSQQSATLLWVALRLGLLGLGCAVMPVRPTIRLLAFAAAAFSQPVLVDLVLGNVSVLVMVLLAVTWRGLDRPLGSVASAIAMSVRPTLGVLILWWAVRRRWAALAWTLLAGLVLIALTLPVVGTQGYQDYVTVLGNVTQVTGVTNNLDLASTVLRLPVNPGPLLATVALYAGYALAVAAMVVSLRFDRDLSFMVTIGATLLLAPLLWDHYLASLVLPAAFLAHRGRPWGLLLPLLAWLPQPMMPLVAIAGTLAPFLAERIADERASPVHPPGDPALAVEPVSGPLPGAPPAAVPIGMDIAQAAGGASPGDSNRTTSPG